MLDSALHGFSALQWGLMLAIAAGAGLVHGFVGIGFPLLATPLFGLLFGWRIAVTLLVLPTLMVTLATLYGFRGQADLRDALRRFWPLPLMMPAGLFAGVWALHTVDASWLMLLMAAVMAVYLVLDRLGRTDQPALRAHPTLLAVPFGLAAGLCEGAVNVAAPALLIYFLLLDLPVASIIAVMSWLFVLGKTVQTGLMAQRGAFDASVLMAALPLGAVGVAMYFGGARLRRRADPSRYRGWLKAMLAVMAAGLVVRVAAGGVT
jgi:uncharacterized membrane protein YfcA